MLSEASTVPVGLKAGEYEITGFLGEGGMGKVYAGVHPVIGKKVAVKVLSRDLGRAPSLIARFIQEARAVNQIGHPNIIDVFAFGESPELGHYFVMPLLSGETLGERLTRGPLPLLEAVDILEKVVEALAAAHHAGIYHRDLKPDNIFLAHKPTGGYVVKVLDFGIAKLSDGNAMTVTKTGVPMGTPMFMSPEQWDGIDVDHRTDIYALGVLLHHMVTGDYPFNAPSPVALMRAHCEAAPVLPSQAGGPELLDPVVARALAKDRNHRFQSSLELFETLQAALSGAAVPMPRARTAASGPVDPTGPTIAPGSARSGWPWALGAVATLAAGGVALAVTLGGGDEPATAAAPGPDAARAAAIDAGVAGIDAAPAVAIDAAPARTVEIKLDSRPRGAQILSADGEILGTTPGAVTLPEGKALVELTLRKAGRHDRTVKVKPSRDRRYAAFRLRRLPPGSKTGANSGTTTGTKSDTSAETPPSPNTGWGKTGNPFGSD